MLKPHQRAVLPDGSTVLERAVTEHNLAAASKLYNNIFFAELGTLLNCAPDRAEAIAARMVSEERLKVEWGSKDFFCVCGGGRGVLNI